jgi:hypothetical protein
VGTGKDEHSGEDVIIVFVIRKVPLPSLRSEDVVPDRLDGVPVRVLAIGDVSAAEPPIR